LGTTHLAWQQMEMSRLVAGVENDNGRPADRVARWTKWLLAEIQLLQQLGVFGQVVPFGIVEELAPTGGHLEEAAAAVEVLAMLAQVLGQMVDPGGEQCDLDFRGAGVRFVGFVFCDDGGFYDGGGHVVGCWVGTTAGARMGTRDPRPAATEIAAEPAPPFESGGMPDQSWREPATGGFPLTQGQGIAAKGGRRKRFFGGRGENGVPADAA